MLTTTGKSILAKYLVNQAPGYAGFIAIGCGANPLSTMTYGVNSAVVTVANKLTVFTNVAHNFIATDTVYIKGVDNAYDGAYAVSSTNLTTTSFEVDGIFSTSTSQTISESVLTNNIATIVTTTSHGLLPGDIITIAGRAVPYNGTRSVNSVTNATAFTLNITNANIASNTTDGGTVYTNIKTIASGTVTHNFASKESLDFEMFRVPIISRAISREGEDTKVVFTAELPTLEQYGMTEIGIYPSGTNPVAINTDSRTLFNFSDIERWEYHADSTEPPKSSYISGVGGTSGALSISDSDNCILINSSDPIFDFQERLSTKEQPRFETKTIMVRGSSSAINTATPTYTVEYNQDLQQNSSHIHHTDVSFNFDRNSSEDQIKLAFSVIPTAVTSSPLTVGNVIALVQFSNSEGQGASDYANMQIRLDTAALTTGNGNSRYHVVTVPISSFKKTNAFQWSDVTTVKLYASIESLVGANISASVLLNNLATITTSEAHGLVNNDIVKIQSRSGYSGVYEITNTGSTTFTFTLNAANIASNTTDGGSVYKLHKDHWVALDGMRFENISSVNSNPLYGLTGYSLLSKTAVAANGTSVPNSPVIKNPNTNNLVEFKFAIDTGGES